MSNRPNPLDGVDMTMPNPKLQIRTRPKTGHSPERQRAPAASGGAARPSPSSNAQQYSRGPGSSSRGRESQYAEPQDRETSSRQPSSGLGHSPSTGFGSSRGGHAENQGDRHGGNFGNGDRGGGNYGHGERGGNYGHGERGGSGGGGNYGHGASGQPSRREGGYPSSSSLTAPSAGDDLTLQAPFPNLSTGLTAEDLRESAYELLVGTVGLKGNVRSSASGAKRGVISDEMKAVLNLREVNAEGGGSTMGPLDVVRKRLNISDAADERIRKTLNKALSSRRANDPCIAPLEMLLDAVPAEYPSMRDFQRSKRRQVLLLEQGLLNHPARVGLQAAISGGSRSAKAIKGAGGSSSGAASSAGDDQKRSKLKKILAELQTGQKDILEASVKAELKEVVNAVADMSFPGAGSGQHWADGWPLNCRLYAVLLGSVFTGGKEATLVEEVEDVLGVVGRTWPVLGINPLVHRLVFAWLFLRQYVASGQKQDVMLVAADFQMRTVVEEAKKDLIYPPPSSSSDLRQQEHLLLLFTLLPHFIKYASSRLANYHAEFPEGGSGFEALVGLSLRAEQVLQSREVTELAVRVKETGLKVPHTGAGGLASAQMLMGPKTRVEGYVRTAVKKAFSNTRETVAARQLNFKGATAGVPPMLVSLAADTSMLAVDSVGKYASLLSQWNSNAGGLTVATVHSAYKNELKLFLAERSQLSVEMTTVLLQAEKLEKQLIEMAVEEGENADDGGALVIQEMPPYETSKTVDMMLNQWQDNRIAKFNEWVDRALQLEKWEPHAMKAFCAQSVVDVLALLDETQAAFFALPLPPRGEMLVAIVKAMEGALLRYCAAVAKSVGNKDQFIPPLPPLTRYKEAAAVAAAVPPPQRAVNSKEKAAQAERDKMALARLLVRINTLHHVAKETAALASRIRTAWDNALAPPPPTASTKTSSSFWGLASSFKVDQNIPLVPPLPSEIADMFSCVRSAATASIDNICEFVGYRVVYHDLRDPALNCLYSGGVNPPPLPKGAGEKGGGNTGGATAGNMRLGGVLERCHPFLVVIADVINADMRDKVVMSLLTTLVHVYQRSLLAGGPSRIYTAADCKLLSEDLSYLVELFVDGGDGLPAKQVQEVVTPAAAVLKLMAADTDDLIKRFEAANKQWMASNPQGGSIAPGATMRMPPVPDKWLPTHPNTLLRVLCYRGDRRASKYLKKVLDLPKEVKSSPTPPAPTAAAAAINHHHMSAAREMLQADHNDQRARWRP